MEFAHEFGVPPGEVGKTSARWWYRWQAWNRAKQTREAYAAAKYYKPHEVPPELRAAMEWANDESSEYVLNPKTQTFEQVTHGK